MLIVRSAKLLPMYTNHIKLVNMMLKTLFLVTVTILFPIFLQDKY